MQISSISVIKTTERKAAVASEFISVGWNLLKKNYLLQWIYSNTAKKIRKLNEQIKFYLKCMVPP
jgi:hypothetical protein